MKWAFMLWFPLSFKAILSQESWKLRGLSAMGKVVINRFLISELTALESNN